MVGERTRTRASQRVGRRTRQPGFLAEIQDLVGRNEIRPEHVELELVETAPLDAAALRACCHGCRTSATGSRWTTTARDGRRSATSLGFRHALQGFLFSPPIDHAGIERLLSGDGVERWPRRLTTVSQR